MTLTSGSPLTSRTTQTRTARQVRPRRVRRRNRSVRAGACGLLFHGSRLGARGAVARIRKILGFSAARVRRGAGFVTSGEVLGRTFYLAGQDGARKCASVVLLATFSPAHRWARRTMTPPDSFGHQSFAQNRRIRAGRRSGGSGPARRAAGSRPRGVVQHEGENDREAALEAGLLDPLLGACGAGRPRRRPPCGRGCPARAGCWRRWRTPGGGSGARRRARAGPRRCGL